MKRLALVLCLVLCILPGSVFSDKFPSQVDCENSFDVRSYYGSYDAAQKRIGYPSQTLKGPITEKWCPPEATEKSFRIGVLFPHVKDSYWIATNYGIVSGAYKHNFDFELCCARGYGDIETQKTQFERFLREEVDGIILASVHYTELDSLIAKSVRQGIPVIGIVNDLNAPAIQAKIMVSYYEMGKVAGDFLIRDSDGKGKVEVGLLPGPINSGWAPETLKGFFDAVKQNPGKIKLHVPRWGDTDYLIQQALVLELIHDHPNIDYIVGNAVAADFAAEIVRQSGDGRPITIISTYLSPPVFEKIKQGTVAASVLDFTPLQGVMAMDIMASILNGRKPGVDLPFRTGPVISLITRENMDQFPYEQLIGVHSFQPVFKLDRHGLPDEH